MNRFPTFAAITLLALCTLTLNGCESSNPTTAPTDQNAYAGGTGVFGEDPVNPGEHSRDRFVNSARPHPAPQTTEPGQ